MRKIILNLIAFSLITGFNFLQADWQILNSNTTAALYDIYFINSNTGYISTSAGIIKTTNAGQNWSSVFTGSVIYSIQFSDMITGYCGGTSGIHKTTNAGVNWFNVFSGPVVNEIVCIEGDVYAAASSGIYKSTDQGANWNSISSGYMNGIFFINSQTGYVAGSNGVYRVTTNSGVNWITMGYWGPPGTYNFYNVYFRTADTGFAAATYNSGWPNYIISHYMYKTERSPTGTSTGGVFTSSTLAISNIVFTGSNKDTGYAVGGALNTSLILKSTNRGNNWVDMGVTAGRSLSGIFFLNSVTGYACGMNGLILKTTNGGITGLTQLNNEVPGQYLLSQNYPNPFNPTTNIEFSLPKSGLVKLVVYDAMGREIETLVNSSLKAGIYRADWNAANNPSGIYFYMFTAENYTETKKMILIK